MRKRHTYRVLITRTMDISATRELRPSEIEMLVRKMTPTGSAHILDYEGWTMAVASPATTEENSYHPEDIKPTHAVLHYWPPEDDT